MAAVTWRSTAAHQGGVELTTRQEQAATLLWVDLPQPLAPGQRTALRLDFAGLAPASTAQGYGIFGRSPGLLALAGWYPLLAVHQDGWQTPPIPTTGDALFAETSLYAVELRMPENYTLVSTGSVVAQTTQAGETTWQIVSGPAREFAAVISTGFEAAPVTATAGTNLHLYALPGQGRANTSPEQALRVAAGAVATLSERYGTYPFQELEVVEAPITIGGYEFSGMVIVDPHYRTGLARVDFEYIVTHELAHQWWYGLVGNDTVHEPWLDEALATYSDVLYREHLHSRATGQALLRYWEARDGARTRWSPPVNSPALDFNNWTAYRTAVYTHGALFLDELRQAMGDQAFFAFLLDYQKQFRYQIGSTAAFLRLAQAHSDAD